MRTYAITAGLVIRHGERTWRLERHLDDQTLVFIDQVAGTPRTMTPAELQRDVLSKKFEVVFGDTPSPTSADKPVIPLVKTLEDVPAHQRTEVGRRYRYLMHLRKKGVSRGMRARIRAEIKALKGHLPPRHTDDNVEKDADVPSPSTVMDWMRRFELSGNNLLSLLTRHATRHNPKRLDAIVQKIGREKVRSYFCARKRPTIESTQREINAALSKEKPLEDGTVKSISLSSVRRLIEEIDPYDRDVARFGAAHARNKWRYSLGGIGAARPMQRYEIDHTTIDVVVISDTTGMPLGRPTITIVIDAFSGCVAGLFISFWGTGLATTIAALKVAIQPKDELCAAQGLEKKWLPYGIPMLMVVDNGLEFHSSQFHEIAMHLCMDLRFCAVRRPWLKPFVERALKTYQSYLPFPGRVEKKLDNYLPLKPEKTATITFSALCSGILKGFVEIHPFEASERRLLLPYDLFSEGMERMLPPSLPISTSELDIIVAATKELTIGNEGAVTNYLRYNSVELQDMRRAIKANFRTQVKFNPEDLSHVYVKDPRTNGWLWVPSCHPEYTDGLSMVQHKAIRAQLKSGLEQRQIPEYLARAKLELAEMWNSQAVVGKRLQAAQLRAMAGLTSTHALTGAPAQPPTPPPAPEEAKLITPEELHVPAMEIPDFEAIELV